MTNQSAGSASPVCFAAFQKRLIVALFGVALATFFPRLSLAQEINYSDFNSPSANPGQTSTSCSASSAGSGVLFCFNYQAAGTDGLSYITDSYPPSIDPNANTDGDIGSNNYALQLTAAQGSQASSMWYSIPQNVADGFNVWYAVKLTPQFSAANCCTADGLAFVIQNAAGGQTDSITSTSEAGSGLTVVGGGGGAIGYGGIDNSVALEMDSFYDSQYDPNDGDGYDGNHIALQSCGPGVANSPAHYVSGNTSDPTSCLVKLNGTGAISSNPASSATGTSVYLPDGNPHQIVMVYNGPNDSPANYLYVYLDPAFNAGTHTPVAGSTPIFSGPFDITKAMNLKNGTAYIGFTAATGYNFERHELMGFTFTPHGYGDANVCPTGQTAPAPCSSTVPVTFNFAASTAIGSIQVVTQGATGLDFQLGSGSTCTGTIAAGNSCTVNVKFAPLAPGLRMGAVQLLDGGGNLLATKLIYGVGHGPATAFGPATQTTVNTTASYPLSSPKGVAVDAAGDVFIADNGNARVVKVAANGTVSLVGSSLQYPQGLAVDGAGDLFIADNNRNQVVEVPAGCTSSSCQVYLGSSLRSQLGVAVDGVGDVFFADFLDGEVAEIPANGGPQTVVYSPGAGSNPVGLAVDSAGDLYIADFGLAKVVELPAGCTSSACQTTVGSGWIRPEAVAVDAAGDVFVADEAPKVVEVPAGCTNISCQITVSGLLAYGVAVDGTGNVFITDTFGSNHVIVINHSQPPSLSFTTTNVGSTSGDSPQSVTIQNIGNQPLDEVSPGLVVNGPNFIEVNGSGTPPECSTILALAPGGACNLSVSFEPQSAGPLSSTAVFTDNALNAAPATQTVALSGVGLATNFTIGGSVTGLIGSGLVLQDNLGNNLPISTNGPFTFSGALANGSAYSVTVLGQPSSPVQICLVTNGSGIVAGANVTSVQVGCTTVPTYALTLTEVGTGSGTLTDNQGQISCTEGSGVATGTCAGSYPSGTMVTLTANATGTSTFLGWGGDCASAGTSPTCNLTISSAVNPIARFDQAQPQPSNPLSLQNNYLVTGDYFSAGVTLRGTGTGGMATGTITIPSSAQGGTRGVPDGADILAAYLYWETVESTPTASASTGTFRGYSITGQQIGNDVAYTDGTFSGTLRVYRADVNAYLPAGANGVRFASGAHTVSLPDGRTALPITEGASLVVIYRVLSQNFPLKAVVIYDGSALPASPLTQTVQGFYDAVGGAGGTGENTNLFAAGGSWNNSSNSVPLGPSNQYSAMLNPGNAYAAVILSTPVNNSDNDGILDAWKTGPPPGDFHAGQPGYYDVKTGLWVSLPGAKHGQKDLFVQLDYMCGALLSDGSCDPTMENLFPSPDSSGNDPLAMVQQAFAATGIQLHLEIGNAVPEDTCTDNTSTNPAQLCQFPNQPGVIGWKNSLEFSKLWPRNLLSCVTGGDCTARFAYGQKDSYHYVLFGHSLAIPAWNTRYGTLASIQVASGVTTLVTTDRGSGINSCPSRITISGVLGNPSLNGVYNTASCADTKTITVATPGVPNWSYPNNTLPEPVIGLTSGTVTSISGYSDLGGADSAVTLGLWLTAPNQDMSKRANVIAGTLFHEIGHTLGLSHGGLYYDTPGSYVPTFEANCKPNYQSVMNYLFQLDLVGPSQTVAFSNQTLTTLNESSASSVTQLTDLTSNPATFPTSAWYVPYAAGVTTASPATRHCDGTPLNSDAAYRVDAPISPITPPWSSGQDINFDGQLNTQMRGYNDFANMDLRQVGATGGEFASLATVLSFGSSAAPLNISAGGNVVLGSGGTVTLGSGGTVSLSGGGNVTLGSGGTITMAGGGNVTLGSGGNVTLGSGGTITPGSGGNVTLGSGGNVTLGSGGDTITLSSGGNVTLGSGGNVTLGSGGTVTPIGGAPIVIGAGGSYTFTSGGTVTLSSGGNVRLGSGGNVTLGSGGNITLGSGGNVTLGSGGNVTLGSGGTITLSSGGNVTLGSGGNVTLGSGGTIALSSGGNVTLGSGGNVTLGSGGTVTLGGTLGSGGNVTLGSGGTATLGPGGTVTVGSGGSVTLSSGGNVTLGSGGTITLGSGGNVTLASGGNVTLGSDGDTITLSSGGNVTLGSGGNVTLGSGGTVTPSGGTPIVIGAGGSYTFTSGGNVTLGSGGNVTLGSGGNVTLGSGGNITLGSGGNVTLGSGGNVTLGSGGAITMSSGGNVTLGSGGNVTLGSGGNVTLGSGGNVTLGSGGNVTLGSGGNVTLGSGGVTSDELTYETANSIVRPPSSPTETPMPTGVRVDWTAPAFGVVETYTIYRSSDGAAPIEIGSVSGVNGNPPATTFTDTNPDLTSTTVVYTISTTLASVPIDPTQRQSPPSPPAVLKNDQTIALDPLPSSVIVSGPQPMVTATAMSSGVPNGLQVTFSATGSCTIGSQSIANSVSSASVALSSTGSCTITASQPGTNAFNSAESVSGTFMILPQGSNTMSQTINFAPLQALQYGGTFLLSASSSAPGQVVSFTASGPCTTSGRTTGVGVCTITASAPGDSTYSAASVAQSFNIYPAVLTVTANSPSSTYGQPLPTLTFNFGPFANGDTSSVVSGTPLLSTTATAGSNAGGYPITVSTGTLAAANYSFLYVSGTLTINQVSQTIAFTTNAPATAAYNGTFMVVATGGASGNAVTFASSGSCSNTGPTYTITSGTGTCSVIANQAGNTNYAAATQVKQTVNATPLAQMITFSAPASVTYGVTPITLTANGGGSGNPVMFKIDVTTTAAATISGNILTVKGSGNLVIDANQLGNSNYQAAPQVQRFIVVNKAVLTVTANSATRAYLAANPTFTAVDSGFVNGDTPASAVSGSPSLTTTAVATSVPGSYPIVASAGTLVSANYIFNFVNGTLTVTFTGSVPTSSVCNGAYSGTYKGSLTVTTGQNCVLVGGGATGSITVTGGNLVLSGATVGSNVIISGASTYSFGSSANIKGNLQIQSIPAGPATNQVCATAVGGSLQYQSNGTSVLFGSGAPACAANAIKGSVQVLNNTASMTIVGNTVSGSLQVQNNPAAITMNGNVITTNVQLQGNTGATIVDGNHVGGSLQDQNNIGHTQVFSNVIVGSLQCQGNTSITGGGNTAGSKQGQCANF